MPTKDQVTNHPVNDDQSASTEWTNLMREIEAEEEWMPYTVECARCRGVLPCDQAVACEGDEWECFECHERENDRERLLMQRGNVL